MYYLLFILLITIGWGYVKPNINQFGTKDRKTYCFVMFLLLFLFAALRGSSVGIDTTNRAMNYYRTARYTFNSLINYIDSEYIYRIIVWAFTRIAEKPYLMEACFAAFIIGVHIWFNYTYANQLPFALALFIIFNFSATMNTTRQYLAISFFLISLSYVINKKLIKAILMILIGVQFHTSAYIGFLFCAFALKKVRIDKKMFLRAIPIAFIAVLAYSPITNFVMRLFPHYARYMNNSFYYSSSNVSIVWLTIYLFITVMIYLEFCSKKYYKTDVAHEKQESLGKMDKTEIQGNAFGVLSITFLVYAACDISAYFIKILYRIMRYFYIGFTILFPDVVISLIRKSRSNRKIFYGLFLLMALGIASIEFKANKYRIFPYVFFWQQ